MPESTNARDEAQRRMFVALAESAPATRRRPGAISALAIFALSGVLAGAATSAAVALTAESRSAVSYQPPSPEQLAASAPGDTQLFGAPFFIESAVGPMSLDVGLAPEGASELFVAFRCLGPGVQVVKIDGAETGTTYCDGPGGGSSTGESVAGPGPHTLSVSGPGEYMIWASWSAPAVPPEPSREQADAVADGNVTEAEYRAGFERYARCMDERGHPLDGVDASQTPIRYVNSAASVQSGVEGACYAAEFALIDSGWQSANQ